MPQYIVEQPTPDFFEVLDVEKRPAITTTIAVFSKYCPDAAMHAVLFCDQLNGGREPAPCAKDSPEFQRVFETARELVIEHTKSQEETVRELVLQHRIKVAQWQKAVDAGRETQTRLWEMAESRANEIGTLKREANDAADEITRLRSSWWERFKRWFDGPRPTAPW